MSAILRFPDFKDKAFTLSYDDGMEADNRLSDVFWRYGVKATFNLCSSFIGKSGRMTPGDVRERIIERGFELACHGHRHYSLGAVDSGVAAYDAMLGRSELEREFKIIVKGMAYANGSYNAETVKMLEHSGIEHCRTTVSTEKFDIPENLLAMPATCHHKNPRLMELAKRFIEEPHRSYYWAKKPRLFYVWGHAYEFDRDNNWELLDELLGYLSGRDDVWYATVGRICEYLAAYRRLRFSADGKIIHNPSAIPVFVYNFDKNIMIPAGGTVYTD